MMNDDEAGVVKVPRPGPIWVFRDFRIPSLAAFGACVTSRSWAQAGAASAQTVISVNGINGLGDFIVGSLVVVASRETLDRGRAEPALPVVNVG